MRMILVNPRTKASTAASNVILEVSISFDSTFLLPENAVMNPFKLITSYHHNQSVASFQTHQNKNRNTPRSILVYR